MFYFKIQFQAVCQLVLWFAENMFWVRRQREQLQKETPVIAQNKKLESSLGQMGFRNTPLNQSSLWFIFNQTVHLWCLWGGIHNELLELKQARKKSRRKPELPRFHSQWKASPVPQLCGEHCSSFTTLPTTNISSKSPAITRAISMKSKWTTEDLESWRKQKAQTEAVIVMRYYN